MASKEEQHAMLTSEPLSEEMPYERSTRWPVALAMCIGMLTVLGVLSYEVGRGSALRGATSEALRVSASTLERSAQQKAASDESAPAVRTGSVPRKDNMYVIIGGGMSGLMAADTLLSQDETAEVTILEAETAVGGRAAKMGATFFQTDTNKFPPKSPQSSISEKVLADAGHTLNDPGFYRRVNYDSYTYNTNTDNSAGDCANCVSVPTSDDTKWHDEYTKQVKRTFNREQDKTMQDIVDLVNQNTFGETLGDCSGPSEAAARCNAFLQTTCRNAMSGHCGNEMWGGAYWEGGRETTDGFTENGFRYVYEYLSNKIKNDYGNRGKIYTGCEVTEVKSATSQKAAVQVSTVCGQNTLATINAKRGVIVTVSVGVLQGGSIVFDPPLPEKRRQVIASFGYGHLSKTIIALKSSYNRVAPWDSLRRMGLQYFMPVGTRASGDTPKPNYYSECYLWPFNTTELVCYQGGDPEFENRPNKKDNTAAWLNLIFNLKGDAIVSKNDLEITQSEWSKNPHFLGAYSFLGYHSNEFATPENRATLAADFKKSAWQDKLLFAGEATNTDYYGTVNGAMRSGIEQAEKMMEISRP